MAPNSSLVRNVIFYEAAKPEKILGGFRQNGVITEANWLDMLAIILVIWSPICVQERTARRVVWRRNVPLESGVYDVHCIGK